MRFRPLQLRVRLRRGLDDLRHLRSRFRGVVRPPWTADGKPSGVSRQSQKLRKLRVRNLVPETADAVSIHFDAEDFQFRAGQFLTLELEIDGESLRRAYSLANAEGASPFITVKRIPDGKASTYLTTKLQVDDWIKFRGPSGSFGTFDNAPGYAVLVAGGSGITPVLSIGETLLRTSNADVLLCYGNRAAEDVIFAERISALKREFLGRFVVEHQLEQNPANGNRQGVLDGAALSRLLSRHTPPADTAYFVCGPAPMMESTLDALQQRGVSQVQSEAFATLKRAKTSDEDFSVTVVLADSNQEHTLQLAGETILEAAMEQRVALPFSCTMGGCGACLVKLEKGQVIMDEPNCLTEDEKEEGMILTCCARPLSDCVITTDFTE